MTMTKTEHTDFETADLGVASFLVAQGVPLLKVKPGDGRRRFFCFPPEAQAAASQYFQGALIPARAFFNAVRDLKAMLY